MRLLAPLGLLGLISIIVLILIYILKPNYQQKFISSTYVWKLSLKYRKKKIPTSKLRNILIIICQVFILAACSAILSKPALVVKEIESAPEVVAIIDASASMRTESMNETRYERAVQKTLQLAEKTFEKNGTVSVIVADNTAEFLLERTTSESKGVLKRKLNELVEDANEGIISCSYSTSDVEGAIELSEKVLRDNPKAKIYLYTDVTYSYVPKGIEVVSVAETGEWNAAILNAYTLRVDGYYQFYVDVACYNKDKPLSVHLTVANANAADSEKYTPPVPLTATNVLCERDETKRIVFLNDKQYDELKENGLLLENVHYEQLSNGISDPYIHSYKSVTVQIEEDDSFRLDNSFEIYDGQREVISIQYYSSAPNPFYSSILMRLQSAYASRYDVQFTEVKKGGEYKLEGFDFYIFEHEMPNELPKDGISMLIDPDRAPKNSGILRVNGGVSLGEGEDGYGYPLDAKTEASNDPVLMKGIDPTNIKITRYTKLELDPSYQTFMSFDSDYPILAVKNEGAEKVVVMPFSVHYSNFVLTKEFPILMYNIFQYFYPSTVTANSFEVNEKVQLKARENQLTVTHDLSGTKYVFTEFPAVLDVDVYGTYTITQKNIYDPANEIEEKIYVKIPMIESNICYLAETLPEPYNVVDEEDYFDDLLLYIAAALVAVLFIEWWLQSRETM